MEALLTAFVTIALAEFGDKTQLLVIALLAAWGRPAPVICGLAAAALTSAILAAYAGALIHGSITTRAAALLLALALAYAGVAGLIGARPAKPVAAGWAPALTAFILLLAGEMGDKSQFLAFGVAARYDSWPLAATGAAAGVIAANLPAFALGAHFRPETARIPIGILFLVVAALAGLAALRLL